MSEFFDQNFWQNIVSGLVILLLSIWLTKGAKSSIGSGKGWKITVIIGTAMILGGLYMFGLNAPNGGFNNGYADVGLSLAILGIPVRYFGKFMVWWHH